jgi:hypothetical protein
MRKAVEEEKVGSGNQELLEMSEEDEEEENN